MTDTLSNADVFEIAGDNLNVLFERHRKYGPNNIARAPGGPLNGLRVRLHDKLARLNEHVDNETGDFADESLYDTLRDISNYGLIAQLVVKDKWPGLAGDGPDIASDDWVSGFNAGQRAAEQSLTEPIPYYPTIGDNFNGFVYNGPKLHSVNVAGEANAETR